MPTRRAVALLAPVLVPVSMTAVFSVLDRRFPARRAYNLGFAVYWLGWCLIFPLWLVGPRRAVRVLGSGRRPTAGEALLLLVPVAGAVATALAPNRRSVDARVAAVMLGSAAVNAVGEELLWRGVFLELFPLDVVRGALWPLAGFTAWHLAPQVVLPSRHGHGPFLLGAGLVGAGSAVTAWRARGLRPTLLPHIATDACGVTAARFRLGSPA